jgi:hypothetical protein
MGNIRTINPYTKKIKPERQRQVKNTVILTKLNKDKDIKELIELYKYFKQHEEFGLTIGGEKKDRFNEICNRLNKQGIKDDEISEYLEYKTIET